ncbi:N-acetyltransferase [Phenylobacterium sp.]|jgi:predicted N-acetyltransferase YhbS|uniref:GNAT family N-acetyltransferase n=1 Tax=Phenylobacterium sp. TaxID=1871053 RepID=UPI002F93F37A
MSVQPSTPSPAFVIKPEEPQDGRKVEALLDHAFGPGRFVKSSERVREFAEYAPEMSLCAWEKGELLGVVRMWRVTVGGEPVVFLGPLAVDQRKRKAGLGGLLVARACHAAEAAGERVVLLVGDPPYFNRFGFAAAVAAGVRMPGPVDQRRVMARSLAHEPVHLEGPVTARA